MRQAQFVEKSHSLFSEMSPNWIETEKDFETFYRSGANGLLILLQ